MIILHDFGIDLEEYATRGKTNHFPLLDACPNCGSMAHGNIHRNGFYWRYGITEAITVKIPICRLKCLQCKVSFSILPDFLIPYFQHTVHTIIARISRRLEQKEVNGGHQLIWFHLRRFLRNVNWIHSYFIDEGLVSGMSNEQKKEATKYVKMIQDFGESPFLRRSWGHLSTYFMAN